MKQGDSCPFCNPDDGIVGHLELVKGYEPWTVDYLKCSRCDSTYNITTHYIVELFGGTKLKIRQENHEELVKVLAQCRFFDEGVWVGDMAIKSLREV